MSEDINDLLEGYEDDVGLEQEDQKRHRESKGDWFRGQKDRSYRIGLLYFHPLDISAMRAAKRKDPNITRSQLLEISKKVLTKRAEERGKAIDQLEEHEKLYTGKIQFPHIKAYYHEVVKYVVSRRGLDGPDADKVWESLGDEKEYYTTVIVIYPADSNGTVDMNRLNDCKVMPWRISGKAYERILQVSASLRNNDLSISSQDLLIKCTNDTFQNFDIDGAGKSVWLKSDKMRDLVLARAVKLYPKVKKPFQVLSTADLRLKLGLDSGITGSDVSDDDDFGDVMSNV